MAGYYREKLAAERLRECYALAPPRVRQYLDAEVEHVLKYLRSSDSVLELGCGYGRVMARLAPKARFVVGADNSFASLLLGLEALAGISNCRLVLMDASKLGFVDGAFDRVVCIQNGISAFHADQRELLRESARITKPGGTILFSSYSDKLWQDRLEWFRIQSERGLLGEIDEKRTGKGIIVCKDGFKATTVDRRRFRSLAAGIEGESRIFEVDGSSLFCEIVIH